VQLTQEPLKPLKGMFVFKKLSEIGAPLCLCSGRGIDILWQFRYLMTDSMLIVKYTRIRSGGKHYNYTYKSELFKISFFMVPSR
jgi:hypothetical protein